MPARALGYRNPKGFAQGSRTAAGSIILTQFTADVMLRFLESILQFDTTKDTTYNKVDQLPPLNMSLLFSNEHGFASYQQRLESGRCNRLSDGFWSVLADQGIPLGRKQKLPRARAAIAPVNQQQKQAHTGQFRGERSSLQRVS